MKLFGKAKTKNDSLTPRSLDLVNWTLTLARWAIYKSSVNYRTKNLTYAPNALFKALVKSHHRFQYKLYKLRHMQYYLPYHWCLGEAFAKVENDTLTYLHCDKSIIFKHMMYINETTTKKITTHRRILFSFNDLKTRKFN